ncbi:thioredoxin-dependent thiol peroxidase [Alkalihalobacillus pseudalcaliphilus]|uniref:thioredoxin-dependent thiol peroxidase n=1 Tax=Alkalihalobacillus pseudalcaliphilus TaxID=79884 RepID=UPI00064DA05E|nr:thioredoxin-dependent thiol peroxidase [Alkalihalobacillus pseudalcaliphilus]KMK74927.1 peroxiredoxin [Alkalihalobacillus pseudalcaliphilus]
MTIKVGEKVPAVSLPASTGGTISISDYKGKYVILYFYPKDMTPGCTTQACDFRDYSKELEKVNAVVLGVSPDPLSRHEKFIEKYDLPFPLLSDEEQELSKLFDVWKLKKNFGKEYMGIERSTFVIDQEGKLAKEWRKVKVQDHVKEVLDYIFQMS